MVTFSDVTPRADPQDVLANRRVGLVAICSCSSSLLVRQRLMDFYSGRLRLPDGRNSSSLLGQLMGVVGAFYSSNSIAVSDTLTTLGRPFVQVNIIVYPPPPPMPRWDVCRTTTASFGKR